MNASLYRRSYTTVDAHRESITIPQQSQTVLQTIPRRTRDPSLNRRSVLDGLDLREDHAEEHVALDVRLPEPDALVRKRDQVLDSSLGRGAVRGVLRQRPVEALLLDPREQVQRQGGDGAADAGAEEAAAEGHEPCEEDAGLVVEPILGG
ncbi:hypothetical protein PG990_001754 [Apiospora arundinis]